MIGVAGATAIDAGSSHACAIVGGGAVRCWGKNDDGQCGISRTATGSPILTHAIAVPGLAGAIELALSDHDSCARTHDGVACWGGGEVDGAPLYRVPGLDAATAIATPTIGSAGGRRPDRVHHEGHAQTGAPAARDPGPARLSVRSRSPRSWTPSGSA